VIRYVFNVGLLHPLLLAGLPGALSFIGMSSDIENVLKVNALFQEF
jgi:hypothetical protein